MHKPGLTEDKVDGLLASQRSGWALCVGAGTSLPAFPNWNELVRRLFEQTTPEQGSRLATELSGLFSPDALIQAALARTEGGPERFAEIITHALYQDFLDAFEGSDRALVEQALEAVRPGDLPPRKWSRFLELLHDRWGEWMSCLAIAPVVSRVLGTERSPAAILSFNAEPLLLSVIHAHQARAAQEQGTSTPQRIDRVVRGISNRSTHRVPYVFCHGLLPLDEETPLDTLVFSESAYLQLASRVYSWQATSFLDACVARKVVFIGLSLTDANMRRWLSWVHDSRVGELAEIGQHEVVSTQHYWLNLDPRDEGLRTWTEASVAHLGVRLVWMESWGSVGPILSRMLEPRR